MIEILFYISLFGILHTYLIYPASMLILGKIFRKTCPTPSQDYNPTVEIIFAAYNEEAVIRDKIIRSFKTKYPLSKLTLRIGSDASTDQTDALINELKAEYPQLHFKRFAARTGKAGILNQLIKDSCADLIIFTDANIIFNEDTIPHLVANMQNPKVGICGGRIVYSTYTNTGISLQESTYLNLENKIKKAESDLFGKAMGVEGGCYIIRRELFTGIPPLYFMEDFYISMATMKKRHAVLFASNATCYEDASVYSSEEYKRKVRISIGNFQNLNAFKSLIITRFFPLGYLFLSHKVLRWFTPFFMLILIPTTLILASTSPLYEAIAAFYGLFIALGAVGMLFSQNKSLGLLKYPGHFIHMNAALLKGFYIYLKGVKSNAWEPTKRNQQ